jgi:hypothetical protein
MSNETDSRAMPNGSERGDEHWNARLIREAAEQPKSIPQKYDPHRPRPVDDVALRALQMEAAELRRDGGTADDWAEMLDGWFIDHGYPAIPD